MKYLLTFLIIVLIGSGIALSVIGIPAPVTETTINVPINVQN